METKSHANPHLRDRDIVAYLKMEGARPYIGSLERQERTHVRLSVEQITRRDNEQDSEDSLRTDVSRLSYQSAKGTPYYHALVTLITQYPQPYDIPALNIERFTREGYKDAMKKTYETGTNHIPDHVNEVLCLSTAACEYYTLRIWNSKSVPNDASGWTDWDHRAIDRKVLKESGVEVRDGQRTEHNQPGPLQHIPEHLLYDRRGVYVSKDREGKVIDLVSQLTTQLNESNQKHPLEITAKDAQAFIHYARAREELGKAFYEKSQPGQILAEKIDGYIRGDVICKYLAANLPLDASAKAAFRDELNTLQARLNNVTGLGKENSRKDDIFNNINLALKSVTSSPSN